MREERRKTIARLERIAAELRRDRSAPLEMVGIRDSFGCSAADYPSLLEHFGLTAAAIEGAVKGLLS